MKAYIYNDEKGDNITVTDDLGDMADQAAEYRTELIEKICELDDDLMMQYLEGEEPSVDDMKKVLRKGTSVKIGKAVFYPDFTILHPLTGKRKFTGNILGRWTCLNMQRMPRISYICMREMGYIREIG